jgi:hypothetical protein
MLNVRDFIRSVAVVITVVGIGAYALHSHAASGQTTSYRINLPGGPPPLVLPPDAQYNTLQPNEKPANPTGRPIAQLSVIPADLEGSIAEEVNRHAGQPGDPTDAPGAIAYQVLSSVRYQGNGHTVYVTTARASRAAEAQGISLGNTEVTLSNGSVAYVSKLPGTQSQVVWRKDGVLITVAGDVASDELVTVASGVVLGK